MTKIVLRQNKHFCRESLRANMLHAIAYMEVDRESYAIYSEISFK